MLTHHVDSWSFSTICRYYHAFKTVSTFQLGAKDSKDIGILLGGHEDLKKGDGSEENKEDLKSPPAKKRNPPKFRLPGVHGKSPKVGKIRQILMESCNKPS